MAKQVSKLSREWIRRARADFRTFLDETKFPDPKREEGSRGPEFAYPEWLIMFIAILSVKNKLKNYLAIHRMVTEYWDTIAEGLKLKPISERQLRDRLKKIRHSPRKPAAFIFQLFPQLEEKAYCER
jgi:hypothetical protein